MLQGQPSEAVWLKLENWWIESKRQWDLRIKATHDQPDWALLVFWRAKTFMTTYMDIINKIAINPTSFSLEELIWKFALLRAILIEIGLVKIEELTGKNLNTLQKLANIGK